MVGKCLFLPKTYTHPYINYVCMYTHALNGIRLCECSIVSNYGAKKNKRRRYSLLVACMHELGRIGREEEKSIIGRIYFSLSTNVYIYIYARVCVMAKEGANEGQDGFGEEEEVLLG